MLLPAGRRVRVPPPAFQNTVRISEKSFIRAVFSCVSACRSYAQHYTSSRVFYTRMATNMDTVSNEVAERVGNGFPGRVVVHAVQIVAAHDGRRLVAGKGLYLCVCKAQYVVTV